MTLRDLQEEASCTGWTAHTRASQSAWVSFENSVWIEKVGPWNLLLLVEVNKDLQCAGVSFPPKSQWRIRHAPSLLDGSGLSRLAVRNSPNLGICVSIYKPVSNTLMDGLL